MIFLRRDERRDSSQGRPKRQGRLSLVYASH